MATNYQFIASHNVVAGTDILKLEDVFSDKYNIHVCVLTNIRNDGGGEYFYTRLVNSSGTTISTSTYDLAGYNMYASSSYAERLGTNYTRITPSVTYIDDETEKTYNAIYRFYKTTDASSYTFFSGEDTQYAGSEGRSTKLIGVEKTQQSITGVEFETGVLGHSFGEGKVSVYGIL
tara:strand:+ start:107 stop:634 length:528 start_codon:yes stop_codon:yes gene_type:complete